MTVWDVTQQAERDRFGYWHDVICQAFVPLTPVRTTGGGAFSGRVETRPLAHLTRARLSSQPQHTRHGPAEVARTDAGWFFVNLQLAGRCHVRQGVHSSVVEPGQFTVVDTSEPYYFDMDSPWDMASYRVPRAVLEGRVRTGTAVDGTGVGGVVTALMRSLWDVDDSTGGAIGAQLTHAFATAVLAAAGTPAGHEVDHRAALHAAVLSHVEHHLTDSELTVAAVCRHFAVSPRTLHSAFADSDDTFAATVRARRLDRCADLLADPAVTTTVTRLAQSHGFDDATSFSRAFRRRFGTSPSEARAQARCTNGTASVR